nr:hypothetical protein [Anaeroplasmataceae bacterium]
SQSAIEYYQSIKDLCATHKKVNTRMSFGKETITFGRIKVAAIKMSIKNISLHLALNPADYVNTKYHFKDRSLTKQGQIYPMVVSIKSHRGLKYALELLEDALKNAGADALCLAESINYSEIFYPRSFEQLIEEGLIKKYVRTLDDSESSDVNNYEADFDEDIEDEEDDFDDYEDEEDEESVSYKVNFTAKLLYEAQNQAEGLYIISSYYNWDEGKAIPMKKCADGSFVASMEVPANTVLEFKICRSKDWKDVEKGIWKEEIVNHNYVIVDKDLEIEDLIYNFRRN